MRFSHKLNPEEIIQLVEISGSFAVGFSRVRAELARTLGLLLCSVTGVPNPNVEDCSSSMLPATSLFFLDKVSSTVIAYIR